MTRRGGQRVNSNPDANPRQAENPWSQCVLTIAELQIGANLGRKSCCAHWTRARKCQFPEDMNLMVEAEINFVLHLGNRSRVHVNAGECPFLYGRSCDGRIGVSARKFGSILTMHTIPHPALQFYILDSGTLGRGQFGTVCPAVDRATGEVVAVKCVPRCKQTEEHVAEEIEAHRQAGKHPNIVGLKVCCLLALYSAASWSDLC